MKQISFPRVVLCDECWSATRDYPVFASAQLSIRHVGEAFGPGDIQGHTERWAFVDPTGEVSCSIVARHASAGKSQSIAFAAPSRFGRTFFEWATDRISMTANGDLPSAFLLAEH